MRSRFTRAITAATVTMMILALGRPAQAISIVPISLQDTIHKAEAIFAGRVLQARSRWGTPEERYMLTDFLFQIDDAILPNGLVQTGGRIILTWPGGSINGLHEGISGLALPEVGKSYVLMLRKDWQEPRMGPEVVPNHGLFRVVQPKGSATLQIQEAEGQPLFKLANGMIVRGRDVKRATATKGVAAAEFKSWLRSNIARIKATPPAPQRAAEPNDPNIMAPIAVRAVKGPINHGRIFIPDSEMRPPLKENVEGKLPVPSNPQNRIHVPGPPATALPGLLQNYMSGNWSQANGSPGGGSGADYTYSHVIPNSRLRIVWNQLHDAHSWSPQDQYQMSKWNHWGDIHRVSASSTGTWAWQNGRYDQCGFPSDATMIDQFGEGWGANTLAVCWRRWDGSGLLESDIAFNPAFSWTLDDEAVYDDSTAAWPYRSTMVHELAHSQGADHVFDFMTIMNYQDKVFRMFGFPYMDDAEGIRANYPGYAQNHYNLANYLYFSDGYQDWDSFTRTPTTVMAGNSITFDDYHVENVGTYNLPTPSIDWYITPNRDYTGTYYYIGTTTYGALNQFEYFPPETVDRTLTIPANAHAGTYYVNSKMADHYDGPTQSSFPWSNRYAWSRGTITITPRLYYVTVSPSISPRNSTATGYVYFQQPSDGRYVSLSSSNTAMATVPSSVYVPSGETHATFTITIPNGSTAGYSVILASLGGVDVSDTAYVVPRTKMLTANVTGALTQTVTLNATLKNSYNNALVASETVYFFVDGSYVGSGVTNTSGKASLSWNIPLATTVGAHTYEATHYTNDKFYYSTDDAVLTVNKASTKLTFTNQTMMIGQTATLKATLKRGTDNALLAGQTINFYESGVLIGAAVTNASGVASLTRKYDEADGLLAIPYTVTFGGSAHYLASSGVGKVTVIKSGTKITIRSVAGTRGSNVKLLAFVQRTSDNKYLNDHELKFYVDGTYVGTAKMIANLAQQPFLIPATMTLGWHNVRVDYADTAFYTASTKNGNLLKVN